MAVMSKAETKAPSRAQQIREINQSVRYAMWSVFRLATPLGEADRVAMAAEVDGLIAKLADEDVVVRGTYDVSGVRADADLMVWWHAGAVEPLQAAYNQLRRTAFGSHLEPAWSQLAMHRPAEFNTAHIPAFMAEEEARAYLCVYPFVRSFDWYVMPEEDRRRMLVEHGQMGREYPDVRANTVAAFALGDYEWILAFEADELPRIVDLMRHLRASEARLHVREETPFFTGPRVAVGDLLERLP